MKRKSLGVDRMCSVFSIVFVSIWLLILAVKGSFSVPMNDAEKAFFVLVTLGVCFLPQLILKIVYWVLDGFEQDKKKK